MASSGMLRRVALVRTDVSKELNAACISLLGLLVTASVAPSSPILVTLMKEALSSFESSVLTRATQRNIPEDTIVECSVFAVYHERAVRWLASGGAAPALCMISLR
jgi:hypothetical protein